MLRWNGNRRHKDVRASFNVWIDVGIIGSQAKGREVVQGSKQKGELKR